MRRRVTCPSPCRTSCRQAAALLLAFAVPLGNQLSLIFLRSELRRSMKWDGLAASRLLVSKRGHHISPCLFWSGYRQSFASALCLRRDESERTDDESLPQVVYWSAAGHYISVLVKSAVHPSAPLIFMEMMISEMDSVLLSSRLSWCQKKEMKWITRDQRFQGVWIRQVHHLFYSKLVLVLWT